MTEQTFRPDPLEARLVAMRLACGSLAAALAPGVIERERATREYRRALAAWFLATAEKPA